MIGNLHKITTCYFDFYPSDDVFQNFLLFLISNYSAHQIFLPRGAERVGVVTVNEHGKLVSRFRGGYALLKVESLSKRLKHRIRIVDKHLKNYKRISNYLKPVSDIFYDKYGIDFSVLEDLRKKPSFIEVDGDVNTYGAFDCIYRDTYMLYISAKYKTSANIDLKSFKWSIDVLKNQLPKGSDGYVVLSQLQGLTKVLETHELESYYLRKGTEISFLKRMEDFLNEAEIIENSQNRYLLGVPSKLENAIIRLRMGAKNLLTDKDYHKYFYIVGQVINIFNPPLKIPGIELLKNYEDKFIPPLLDTSLKEMELMTGSWYKQLYKNSKFKFIK